jgi:hypothetical protein
MFNVETKTWAERKNFCLSGDKIEGHKQSGISSAIKTPPDGCEPHPDRLKINSNEREQIFFTPIADGSDG